MIPINPVMVRGYIPKMPKSNEAYTSNVNTNHIRNVSRSGGTMLLLSEDKDDYNVFGVEYTMCSNQAKLIKT